MPARKSYRRKRPLSYAAYSVGKELDNQMKAARLAGSLGLVNADLGASALASANQRLEARRTFGRGAYWGRDIGQMAGSAIGGRFGLGNEGGAIGARFGDWASSGIERVIAKRMGRGAYSTNSLIDPQGSHRPIASASDETGDIVITHSEYVQDVIPTTSAFQSQVFQVINPGLPGFVPWLSQIAQYFEEYEMLQCAFEFKSMVTEGNSTAAGTVMMATQYNPLNPPFASKQAMENYEHANSCKMTDSSFHGVECDPSKHGGNSCEYVRTGPVPAGQDAKTYDLAVFQLATNGAAPDINVGELWVHYSIRLSKAKVVPVGSSLASVFSASVGNHITSTQATNPLTSGSGQYNYGNLLALPASPTLINDTANGYDTSSACTIYYTPSGSNVGATKIVLAPWINTQNLLITVTIIQNGTGVFITPNGINASITGGGTIGGIDRSGPSSAVGTSSTETVLIGVNVDSPAGTSAVISINVTGGTFQGTVTEMKCALMISLLDTPFFTAVTQ